MQQARGVESLAAVAGAGRVEPGSFTPIVYGRHVLECRAGAPGSKAGVLRGRDLPGGCLPRPGSAMPQGTPPAPRQRSLPAAHGSVRGRRGAETPGGDPFRALAGPTLGRGEKRGGAGWTVATGPSYNRRALATSIGREPVADQASAWRPGNEAAHSHEGAGTAVIVAGCPGTTHRLKGSYLYEPENRYQSCDRLWRHGRRFRSGTGKVPRGGLRAVHLRAQP